MKEETEAEIRRRIAERMKTHPSWCDLLKDFQVDENKAVIEYDTVGREYTSPAPFQAKKALEITRHFFDMSSDEARHRGIITRLIRDNCSENPKEK